MRLRRGAAIVSIAALMASAPAPAGFTMTWQGHDATEEDQTTYTFAGKSIGTAAADRIVTVAIGMGAVSSTQITSVTIGGVTATARVTEQFASGRIAECWDAVVPTGTTADIVITHSVASNSRISIDWWTITGGEYSARSGQYPDIQTSATSITSTAVTIPTGGGAVALCRIGLTTDPTVAWSQTSGSGTARTDAAGGDAGQWIATYDTLAAGSQQFTVNQGGAAAQMRILAVAYGPAS